MKPLKLHELNELAGAVLGLSDEATEAHARAISLASGCEL